MSAPHISAFARFRTSLATVLLIGAVPFFSLIGEENTPPDLTPGETAVLKRLPADVHQTRLIRLWPEENVPDEIRNFPAEEVIEGKRSPMIRMVTVPSLILSHPSGLDSDRGPRPVVLVCPGGGYGGLSLAEGGTGVIQWLNARGLAGAFLKYRVPKRHQGFPMHHHATQDIQRAISLLRHRAEAYQIDPDRIGTIGFSAGGHLVAMASTNHADGQRYYDPIDKADTASCRPDFAAMVAPAYLTQPIDSDQLDPALRPAEIRIHHTPPTFLTSAVTDKFTIGASHYLLALRKARVPVEVHFFEKGGHAEGIHDRPDNQWPAAFQDWLQRRGVLALAPSDPE